MRARRAATTLLAVIASFGTMFALCRAFGAQTQPAILAAVLAIGLSQRAMPAGIAAAARAALRIAAIGLVAGVAGWLLHAVPLAGAVVFIGVMSLAVLLRQFGGFARSAGAVIALPLVALLIVPIVPDPALPAVVNAALAIGAGVVALAYAAALQTIAERFAFLARPHSGAAAADVRARTGLSPHTRMAAQMAVALTAAFACGFLVFPQHWGWTVLTAFIVCGGAIGRGDAVVKAVLRLAGAIAGTVVVAVLASLWSPGGALQAVVIFVVLFFGLWLRDVNYAYWAAAMTVILALLSGSNHGPLVATLGVRLEAMLCGAACAVAAAWFVMPIRTVAVIRRRLADALLAFDALVACAPGDDVQRATYLSSFEHALAQLERVAVPVRWHRNVLGQRVPANHPAGWIDLAHALRDRTHAHEAAARRAAIRRAIGQSRRAIAAHGAPEPVPDAASIGTALARLHETLAPADERLAEKGHMPYS